MHNQDLYNHLLDGNYSYVLESLHMRKKDEKASAQPEIEALALALSMQVPEANWVIENQSEIEVDGKIQAIWTEAELVLAIQNNETNQRITELATKAIGFSNSAVFAHRVLGELAERARHADEALQHYQVAFQASPQNDRSLRDLARLLAQKRQNKEALRLVAGMAPSLRREIYRFSILLRGLRGLIVALGLAFLLINPFSNLIVLTLLLGIGLILIALGYRWRDGLIFATGTRVCIFTIGIFILGKFLTRVTEG
jgi:tetratricopeptide (TPR) repeat protein